MKQEYYLGLDMGTSSVGWAVTDKEYHLLRKKGKDLWGVRLFSEAVTSEKRRGFRTARRRLQREKARIGYLKELFAEEIQKVDPGFYQRLEDSKYYEEDKEIRQPFALFADQKYTDKQYYEDYPTIFHLRRELMESEEPHDVRLVYLAILNMFKHRGHFLNANLDDRGIGDLSENISSLKKLLEEYDGELFFNSEEMQYLFEKYLPSKEYGRKRKCEQILLELGIQKNKVFAEIVKMICGLQGKLSVIFTKELFDEETKKFALSFKDGNYEEKQLQAEEILSEEAYEILLSMKQIHDWGILANILQGHDSLSKARVYTYEKHQYDLTILKSLLKQNAPKQYDQMFRVMEENNYSSYVGSVNSGKEKVRRFNKGSSEGFFLKVKKIISSMPESEEKDYVLNEIEKETFLPKQLTSSNGVIPNQVHKMELKKILNQAEKYLPFLKETDESGLTVSEKIISLFEFQIPYYIGPLIKNENGNAWIVRKQSGKVFPWNFDEMVDQKATAEKFIEKMVKHCTYLNDEKVLPKNSLLYEKFLVLNELNNLRINDVKISVEMKQRLFNELFKKGKKVRQKDLIRYLQINGMASPGEDVEISGIDVDFKNTLSNYAKFCAIFQTETLTYEQEKLAENIIFWSTVYGDSKSFLKEKIEENYGNLLNKEQIKRILGLKFKDWGKLSKEFLELSGIDKEFGDESTIISRLWNNNCNLMELLSKRYSYLEVIQEKVQGIEKNLTEIVYEDLEELYISSPVRRMIWQTILILKELYKVLGSEPSKIFVEMARDVNAKKERKDSRKQKFIELYKNCKEDGVRWSEIIKNTSESEFRSKKLYLYYTQKGRCMYTGERIELEDLIHNDRYDIDHIYPRHFVKDDSIENNLVLVKKEKNAHKSDTFPIEKEIRESQKARWKLLKDGGFITEEKYKRLVRNTEFTPEERAAFINRQIVEVRQGTKVITDLLEKTFGEKTEVVYVKAGNVSEFRRKYDLLKCRDVNDYHHATDAYLNIVVGNVYHVKFTKNPLNFIREYEKDRKANEYHMYRVFDFDVVRNGEFAWRAGNHTSMNIVKKVMKKQTPIVTRMNYEEHGGLADQTIYSAADAKKADAVGYLPIKRTDSRLRQITKYGGFKKFTGTYFFLIEYENKGKKIRTLEAMPLYMKETLDSDEKIEAYCRDVLKYENPKVKLRKIKMYSLIKVDGFYLYLTGRSGNKLFVSNAVELSLSYEQSVYIKRLKEFSDHGKLDDEWLEKNGITRENNIILYDFLCKKHFSSIYAKRPNPVGEKLIKGRKKFESLSMSDQIYILLQILQLSKLSNMGADLTKLGESKKTGVMTLNKKISEKQQFELIHQSPAGLYEQSIDLLKI